MARDSDILTVFEVADDSLQGVLGYHLYVSALQETKDISEVLSRLPDNTIPHTFSWVRRYQKESLINAFGQSQFEYYQCRITLMAMTNVYEVVLASLIDCLNKKGLTQYVDGKRVSRRSSYRVRIKWAFQEASKCDFGDNEALARLPITFGIIDNARRLRNIIVHSHGLFNSKYESDAIGSGINVEMELAYESYKQKPDTLVPVDVKNEDIIRFSCAHIETLHVLHNHIQKDYFGFAEPYDYHRANKAIEWERVLWGGSNIRRAHTRIVVNPSDQTSIGTNLRGK